MSRDRPVVLITGGSRGIGAAVAQLAATRGYDVAVNSSRTAMPLSMSRGLAAMPAQAL
jgi:NAD(P)-dependent dehydrogenase (short-subunit alcohol dehydrogenase family)